MTKKFDTSFAIKSIAVSILLIALLLLPLLFYSCKENSTGPTTVNKSTPATVGGKVYGKGTVSGKVQQLIAGVMVTLQAVGDTTKQTYTTIDSTGYHFTVAFSDSPATKSVTLTLAAGGYFTKTSTYNVSAGQNITTWRDTLADTTFSSATGSGNRVGGKACVHLFDELVRKHSWIRRN